LLNVVRVLAWIEGILDMQLPSGGVPNHPGSKIADPHTSALALWALLEPLHPNAPRVPWIVQRERRPAD
jgi:hypothetical protein